MRGLIASVKESFQNQPRLWRVIRCICWWLQKKKPKPLGLSVPLVSVRLVRNKDAQLIATYPRYRRSSVSSSTPKRRHAQHGCQSCPRWALAAGGWHSRRGPAAARAVCILSQERSFRSPGGNAILITFAPDLTNVHVFYTVTLPEHVTVGRGATRGQGGAGLGWSIFTVAFQAGVQ